MINHLETERLIVRPLEIEDAPELFIMDSNPLVHNYLWNKPSRNISESIQIIKGVKQQYEIHKIGRFATILKENGDFIGWTGIKFVTDHIENGNTNFYDFGYRLNTPFWNKGYASEATNAWIDYGFNNMKIKELNAYTHSENEASNRVLQKNGFQFMEAYPDTANVLWNWWLVSNNKKINNEKN
jgi:ribosomal-protein-alanine N-acetyltransferase